MMISEREIGRLKVGTERLDFTFKDRRLSHKGELP